MVIFSGGKQNTDGKNPGYSGINTVSIKIDLVVNIPKNLSSAELSNGYKIRRAAIDLNIPLITNARLASAFIYAFCTVNLDELEIRSWQEF